MTEWPEPKGRITAIMQALIAAATDPDEIAKRQLVLDDHVAAQQALAERMAADDTAVNEADKQVRKAARKK